ncbi:MAG: CBS domain-containing protein [Gammaproteobacteria bacterium]|jgi:predicted transcriptional regulator
MKLEHLSIATGVMRNGMIVREFFEECVRCNVPGLPYVDDQDRVVGRISIRDVYKHMAIPDHLVKVAHVLGDHTDKLDLPEMKVVETLALPVESYLLENIPGVSPQSSIVKALAIMEMFNTSYIFLLENGEYRGLVTRMVIAHRMLLCVKEYEAATRSGRTREGRHDACFPNDE